MSWMGLAYFAAAKPPGPAPMTAILRARLDLEEGTMLFFLPVSMCSAVFKFKKYINNSRELRQLVCYKYFAHLESQENNSGAGTIE